MNPEARPAGLAIDDRPVLATNDAPLPTVRLSGDWTLAGFAAAGPALARELASLAGAEAASLCWDARDISALDSAGALRLRTLWGGQRPATLMVDAAHGAMLDRILALPMQPLPAPRRATALDGVARIGGVVLSQARAALAFVCVLGQFVLDLLHGLRHPRTLPWKEFSANLYKSGVRAMPVTALVGVLIGIVLSYLSALQLRQFGADVFIVNILGLGIVRELGPLLTALLVAGRSGSAMTAQLGVMRVTEEIDALAAMGVSRSLRLIFPKVAALALVMPLLVLWTSAMAMAGGMLAAWLQLDLGLDVFVQLLPRAVPIQNLWLAQLKGMAFGIAVALVACHYGLRVRPNTESLSANTTASVVVSITAVILIDAVFAISTRSIGLPKV